MTKPEGLYRFFELSQRERARLEAIPVAMGIEPSKEVTDSLLTAYADGEIDFRRMIAVTRSCSLGCTIRERVMLLAIMAELGLRIKPKKLRRRRPTYPTWLRRVAGLLIKNLSEEYPDLPLAPSVYSPNRSPILGLAQIFLVGNGFFDGLKPVSQRRLYDWYRATRRADGDELKRGRPPRRKTPRR